MQIVHSIIFTVVREGMSELVKRNLDILKVLNNCDPKLREAILTYCPTDTIDCLCQIIRNLLAENIPIEYNKIKKLKPHKEAFRKLASKKGGNKKKNTIKEKRRLLIQEGGFLPVILGPLLSAASGIITSLIGGD